jgi:transcription initiation factor TFIIIB Brf1 subunit/transcription initiation factor TFIIB
MSRRSLRFSKSTCPICGSKEVARDDNKGDLLCTNCGHIIVRTETRAVGKYDIAQHIKRNGKMTFPLLQSATGASDDKLFGVLRNMVEMGLLSEIQGQYALTKKGNRWYRQRHRMGHSPHISGHYFLITKARDGTPVYQD